MAVGLVQNQLAIVSDLQISILTPSSNYKNGLHADTVVCPNLDDPSNGSVLVDSTFYGGRAYYNCNPGYQLSQYSSRYCQISGSWSGTQPTCISE